jgi:putative transposase
LAEFGGFHRKTLTFVAALRGRGIDAPCVFDGPINGESFKAYVEQGLAPALRPGDIVVTDSLGSHKGSAIRRAIRAAGAHHPLFLPCDLSPENSSRIGESPPTEEGRTTKGSRFTEEQIIGILRAQEAGAKAADGCRKHGIRPSTFFKGKAKFGGMDVSEARRLKTLEDENAKLKKLLAEAMRDNAMLTELAAKKW